MSGSTGMGSRAARQARDTVRTFISKKICMTIEPSAMLAREENVAICRGGVHICLPGQPPRCGYWDCKISQ